MSELWLRVCYTQKGISAFELEKVQQPSKCGWLLDFFIFSNEEKRGTSNFIPKVVN